MVSIRDVARKAGVSPSTVSRVMNGTANVDEEKRERVLAAISETGFKPNELARALFKQSSKIIGVIVPNIENPFFGELARAVEEEAYRGGYKILLCNSNNDSAKEHMNIQMLQQMKADGVVIMSNSDSTGRVIAQSGLPFVTVDRRLAGGGELAMIESDHYEGGRLAAEHLISCGCRSIVCMSGPRSLSSGRMRYQAYRDVCEKYGRKEQVIECGYDYRQGLEAAQRLLALYPNADGIIASNDMTAVSVYKALVNAGRRVPEDVQLIGFDNIQFSWLFTPELTTIAQPIAKMGALAARILIGHGKGESFEKENVMEVALVKRQTTGKRES